MLFRPSLAIESCHGIIFVIFLSAYFGGLKWAAGHVPVLHQGTHVLAHFSLSLSCAPVGPTIRFLAYYKANKSNFKDHSLLFAF